MKLHNIRFHIFRDLPKIFRLKIFVNVEQRRTKLIMIFKFFVIFLLSVSLVQSVPVTPIVNQEDVQKMTENVVNLVGAINKASESSRNGNFDDVFNVISYFLKKAYL